MSFAAKLSDMPLIDAIRMFQRTVRSGKLMLWGASERGVIWMLHGQVVHAIVLNLNDRRLLHTSEAALRDLLNWNEGHFRFTPGDADCFYPVSITTPTLQLLASIEQTHVAELYAAYAGNLTPATMLEPLPQREGMNEKLHMSAMEWVLLVRVGQESKTLQELAADHSTSFEHIAAMATTLLKHGLVRIVGLQMPSEHGAMDNLNAAIRRRLQQQPKGLH
ncbi:DUF4388 domain-containing protein [Candidatus Viridilinea mediisalina]|uniref:PatA-like N-terminal domain-containing protein n=1 Tax=Candidatus Viridilinea mediisalina TaxID=2024553 RepID=A0A2A6RGR5_9CHLR|nr:DUF4388 domain-containing protein [Candidatus Viridilinea mediisalina]PDW02131.1 hypothetical protein CJ255_15575 [Candidatus Viridilinea mediisalina]